MDRSSPGLHGIIPTCPGTVPSCGSAGWETMVRSQRWKKSPAGRMNRSFSPNGRRTARCILSRTAPAGGTFTGAVENQVKPVLLMEAEFGMPQWLFGMSTYAFESEQRLICAFTQKGSWQLAESIWRPMNTRLSKRLTPISPICALREVWRFLSAARPLNRRPLSGLT